MAAVKNRPLGTQAAPVCEDGVFTHDRLMTADCSRAHAVQKCARAGQAMQRPPTASRCGARVNAARIRTTFVCFGRGSNNL
jgi:hypothetical protein